MAEKAKPRTWNPKALGQGLLQAAADAIRKHNKGVEKEVEDPDDANDVNEKTWMTRPKKRK